METAVTFATSDVDKLNSIKDFIRSLNVFIIQEEDIPQPIEMTPRLVDFLNKIEAHNTPFEECENFDVMINEVASEYGITL
ncbi:hypothetical protein [Capnocytophaga sp. oral taxon 326]|jgi:hypothetical protein|uniref:hypothetical protein n=1 Tax=Capnocytophaga sp. oral taxon 326 TaxID=712212 RepID=UPI0002A42822|nr:hypothetical protein [Capnocytophaga sp. oral taxon 326]EKY21698.1 hypothetical protein HMPREF9073_00393 [Capnocytophaga sp. oral taxon 326 str. F0382]